MIIIEFIMKRLICFADGDRVTNARLPLNRLSMHAEVIAHVPYNSVLREHGNESSHGHLNLQVGVQMHRYSNSESL